jgi:hypothetical protein
VGGSEAKKGPGSLKKKNGVFELPPPRNAQDRDIFCRKQNGFGFLSIFCKVFRHDFSAKRFL